MGGMALVVLGLFVLVWIISAVVKASQDNGPKRRPDSRPRPVDGPRVERTSNSDIDRFMAEIDRLRRKGEGHPSGRAGDQSRQSPRTIAERPPRPEQRPKPVEQRRERERDRDRDRERRPRSATRPAPVPPPLTRTDPVPVLRPVTPQPPAPPPSPPPKPARPAKLAAIATSVPIIPSVPTAPLTPVAQTLQTLLRSPQGPAVSLILGEVFGEPRGRKPMRVRGR
jgi:hypothetical protein